MNHLQQENEFWPDGIRAKNLRVCSPSQPTDDVDSDVCLRLNPNDTPVCNDPLRLYFTLFYDPSPEVDDQLN